MNRFFRWHLPVFLSLVAAVALASGFVAALRGNAGDEIDTETTTTAARPDAPSADRILVMGDSLARGAGDESGLGIGGNLERTLPGSEVVNLGVNGATTRDLAARLERPAVRRLAAESAAIVISIGGNDLFRAARREDGRFEAPDAPLAQMDEVVERVAAIVGTAREASPAARIFVLGLYDPFRDENNLTARAVAEWNGRLALRFVEDPRITVVPTSDLFVDHDRLSRDRFHPGAEAYEMIARRIADAVR